MRLLSFLTLLLFANVAAKGAISAGDKDFNSKVLDSGKNAFVKFLAPWWGHCKSMKADWDKLADKYASSDSVMIVDVDCTADGKSTCGKHGVKGYPTIQYFMAGSKKGKPYQQGRDYTSLANFAKNSLETVAPKCDAVTGKNCLEIEKRFIEQHQDSSVEELSDALDAKSQELKDHRKAQKDHDSECKTQAKELKKGKKKLEMASSILKDLKKNAQKVAASREEL